MPRIQIFEWVSEGTVTYHFRKIAGMPDIGDAGKEVRSIIIEPPADAVLDGDRLLFTRNQQRESIDALTAYDLAEKELQGFRLA